MKDRRCPRRMWSVGAMMFAAGLLAGCGSKAPAPTAAPAGPAPEGAQFVLPAAPENAQGVLAVRQTAAGGEEVVVVGRIGGSTQPFVEGMAAFSLVDNSLRACSDIPGDQCPTPWDFCCEAELPKARTLVKFVDESGQIIPTDARTLLGVSELQTVYVRGQAHRDADGNLTVLARGVSTCCHRANGCRAGNRPTRTNMLTTTATPRLTTMPPRRDTATIIRRTISIPLLPRHPSRDRQRSGRPPLRTVSETPPAPQTPPEPYLP